MSNFLELIVENQLKDLQTLSESINLKSSLSDLTKLSKYIEDIKILNTLITQFYTFSKYTPRANDGIVYNKMRNDLSHLITDVSDACNRILLISDIPQVNAIKKLLIDISHTISVIYNKNRKAIK